MNSDRSKYFFQYLPTFQTVFLKKEEKSGLVCLWIMSVGILKFTISWLTYGRKQSTPDFLFIMQWWQSLIQTHFYIFFFQIKPMFISVMYSCPELPWKCRYFLNMIVYNLFTTWNCSAKKGRWDLLIFPPSLSVHLSIPSKGIFFQTITLPLLRESQ